MNTNLWISSKSIRNCEEVAELLRKNKIMSNVTQNTTIQCNDNKYIIETGCNIFLSRIDPEKIEKTVWIPLQKEFNLQCGYLDINAHYVGCIHNFLRVKMSNKGLIFFIIKKLIIKRYY